MSKRLPEHQIHDQFLNRWSPRAYTGEAIDDTTLFSLFEAARWAPSGSNSQPWRFIYVKNDSPAWRDFTGLLKDANAVWAPKAAALVLLLSRKTWVSPADGSVKPANNHSFDAGAAWAHLSLQAVSLGWHTRAMGGYDKEAARKLLSIPDDYHLEVLIAIGRQAPAESLPAHLQEREQPSLRKPLNELIADSKFDFV